MVSFTGRNLRDGEKEKIYIYIDNYDLWAQLSVRGAHNPSRDRRFLGVPNMSRVWGGTGFIS
jgi:hypothetical protein